MRAARGGFFLLLCGALSCAAKLPGFQQLSHLSSYEIVTPQKIERERQDVVQQRSTQDALSFVVRIQGEKYTLHVKRNKDLVPKDFTLYTYDSKGNLQSEIQNMQNHCHYQGYVEGVSNSMVVMSTCSGLRGLVQIRDATYGISQMSTSVRHAVYPMESVKKDARTCGVPGGKSEGADTQHHSTVSLLRRKRGILQQTRYVELFIVVDKERYHLLGQNKTAVREEMVQLANHLDSMYIMLNIRIVLVGLEIWTFENKIQMEGGAGDVLSNFVQWRELNLVPRQRHDTAQLVLMKKFGGTAGMAYVGTVCSKSHAGGINVFGSSVQEFASIVAHELGHNLGMNHDNDRNCYCEAGNCIMNSSASGARNFSKCSEEDFEKLTLNKGGSCLLNIPSPDEIYSVPFCGNKLVDAGEECDCGSVEECKSDPCCEAQTCRLRRGAICGYGDCCKDCQYLSKGTLCREKANECDLPEYCNGTSSFCPQDVTIQNGHPCHNDEAYCYNGACQYYQLQCQDIFGPQAKVAPEMCFLEVNSKGDRFGNCGYQNREFKKCSTWSGDPISVGRGKQKCCLGKFHRNAMCGKLQCENVKTLPVFGIKPAIIQTPIGGNTCWGVDFQLGSDVPDPGMVNEGTKCAPGKVCKHYQCVDVSVLGYDCDVKTKCSGRGVCNSNKNCHCHSEWAPPYCDSPGYGGSIDSGPTYNENTAVVRNWIVAFVILLSILSISLFVYCKRNQIVSSLSPLADHCCRRFQRPNVRMQEPVRMDGPPIVPYSSRVAAPSMVMSPKDHQHIPPRPPPPMAKITKPQNHFYPSRPAPLPPL